MAITAGTKAEAVVRILRQLPERKREKVVEVTIDMAGNTELIVKRCFANIVRFTDWASPSGSMSKRWEAVENHYKTIINYLIQICQCFRGVFQPCDGPAKVKAFRLQFRGVKNVELFLYRLAQLYA